MRESCPQLAVLKHSRGPCLHKSRWKGDLPRALIPLHWTGVKVQGPGAATGGATALFVLPLPASKAICVLGIL